MRPRTVLIGLDGATFTILDPLMRDGVMPFLREFVGTGVRASLRSVVPALTPPAWTSLATGCGPGRHGVFDFFCRESADSHLIRVATSRDVNAETIWSIASRHGYKTTVLNFPLMFPAPEINGYVVPGWMPWRQLRLGCRPEGLFDRLKSLPGIDIRELAIDTATEAKAIEGCSEDEYEEWVELHIRREQQWFTVLSDLMRSDPSELTAVLFDGIDKIQHLCWRFLDPACTTGQLSGWEARVRELCLDYFRRLDGLMADIVSLAGPEATVLLASDHGFGAQKRTLFINAWLEEKGYLAWADDEVPRTEDPSELGISQLARHIYQIDWTRTKAYVSTPSSNGIHIVSPDPTDGNGASSPDYEALRAQLISELESIADETTGEPVVSRVWTREEIFRGPFERLAPDLTLELQDGGLVSVLRSDVWLRQRPVPSGTHRPEGIFIGRGPGWRKGTSLPTLSIKDVAPLVLESLGIERPEEMEGRTPRRLYDRAHRESPPPVTAEQSPAVPVETPAQPVEDPPELSKEDEEALAEHLRKLGYLS
jgi:predicted AlkP superfamily phosphohydrolase/phosphomutase